MGVEVSHPVVPVLIGILKEGRHPLMHPVRVSLNILKYCIGCRYYVQIVLRYLNAPEGEADTKIVYAKCRW